MGLLDDAIREHLELKRRRGADVAEVTRQEKEAFGPIGAIAEEVPEPAPPEAPTRLHVAEEPVAPAAGREFVTDPHPEPEAEPQTGAHAGEAGGSAPSPHGDPADELPSAVEPAAPPQPEPVPPEPEFEPIPDPAAPAATSQPTREFDLDEVRAATGADVPEPDAGGVESTEVVEPDQEGDPEDVLEETPEFLQETPEHDRLWFEQRPPRDFDF